MAASDSCRLRSAVRLGAAVVLSGVAMAAVALAGSAAAARGGRGYRAFVNPRPITLRGYAGDAMEPFISADGRYMLFNSLNQPPVHTVLRWAKHISGQTFAYRGAIAGANDPNALTAVPALAGRTLFFVSSRSYAQTLATVYRGHFANGHVSGVRLVPGVVAPRPGIVDFDVGVDADATMLCVSEGQFNGGAAPAAAQLVIFTRTRAGYARDAASGRLLAAVNRPGALTYAAAISANDKELFFTQVIAGGLPTIYRAVRTSAGAPFAHVQPVAAITGYSEAPSLSSDGGTLYYHRRVGRRYKIYFVTRNTVKGR